MSKTQKIYIEGIELITFEQKAFTGIVIENYVMQGANEALDKGIGTTATARILSSQRSQNKIDLQKIVL